MELRSKRTSISNSPDVKQTVGLRPFAGMLAGDLRFDPPDSCVTRNLIITTTWKPTKEQLLAAAGKTVPDVIAPRLKVLFCGINPGLYTAAVGHHFARPGNRFWPALYAAGFTDTLVSPFAERELLRSGYGVTNVVMRTTATADELTREELRAGGKQLSAKVRRYKPAFLAVLGLGAYRTAWERPKAVIGRQDETLGETVIWVLPNPSGLNAHYQAKDLARLFSELKVAVDRRE